jgi:hypothetical protein
VLRQVQGDALKTIFHVGHSKTGSTTLQSVFLASQENLAEKGVLYPTNPNGIYSNHKLLFADMMAPGNIPRHILKNYSRAELPAAREELQQGIQSEIERLRPDCLLLSSESRFGVLPASGRAAFRDVLRSFGSDDIDISAYIRRPSSWYLSALNQRTRRCVHLKQPRHLNLTGSVAQFVEDFGADHVYLRPFERDVLKDRDIVADFCHSYLSEYGISPEVLSNDESSNESFSNEAMDVVRRFRAAFLPGMDDRFVPEGEEILEIVMQADASLSMPKPKLRTGLGDALDYGSRVLLNLRDRYGFSLPGYDYARAEATVPLTMPEAERLEDIIEIDRTSQANLIEEISRDPWISQDSTRAAWFAELPVQIERETRDRTTIYASATMASDARFGSQDSGDENMSSFETNLSDVDHQNDRETAVSVGRALFRLDQKGKETDKVARKAAWASGRRGYVQQGRAILKQLRKDGFELTKPDT